MAFFKDMLRLQLHDKGGQHTCVGCSVNCCNLLKGRRQHRTKKVCFLQLLDN